MPLLERHAWTLTSRFADGTLLGETHLTKNREEATMRQTAPSGACKNSGVFSPDQGGKNMKVIENYKWLENSDENLREVFAPQVRVDILLHD